VTMSPRSDRRVSGFRIRLPARITRFSWALTHAHYTSSSLPSRLPSLHTHHCRRAYQ
jgi:hypothetical protein